MPRTAAYSRAYLVWAMGLLLLIYTSNFIDRTILSVLQQPIKEELKLSDGQMGILGGFAFAILYATLGIPIARLAERRSRRTIITLSVLVWSLMTALCGTAVGFAQLFAFRVGVGVGEAGASPPSQSLIADYYPPHRRATALSVYSLGVPLGSLLGAVLGGWIAATWGWRRAFFVVGAPGIVLAVLAQFTLREPTRGQSDAPSREDSVSEPEPALADSAGVPALGAAPSLMDVVRRLGSRPSFLHMAAGASLTSFGGYGIGAFAAPYFIREFHVGLQVAGLALGLVTGAGAALGTLAGGLVTDRAAKRDARWYAWVPAIGVAASVPFLLAGYLAPTFAAAVPILMIAAMLQYVYLGPTYGTMHNMVTPRMRATATALLLLTLNLVGLGLGPTLVGLASDAYAGRAFHGLAPGAGAFLHACPGGRAPAGSAAALVSACGRAGATGVREAILTCAAVYLWAALHYLLAGRRLREDLAR